MYWGLKPSGTPKPFGNDQISAHPSRTLHSSGEMYSLGVHMAGAEDRRATEDLEHRDLKTLRRCFEPKFMKAERTQCAFDVLLF